MPNEIDPTQLAIPTMDMEAMLLPLSAQEVGLLQRITADFKKRNPFKAQDPTLLRLETKLAFLFTVVLALGEVPELVQVGREKLKELYEVLLAQKLEVEKRKAGG
jgi:hypothetical protein